MRQRAIEVERKWLIENPPKLPRRKGAKITQGYLVVSSEGIEVRVRRKDGKFFETIKTGTGLKRGEIEIELSRKQFRSLWTATQGRRLEKVRYTLKWQRRKIELDVYKKELAGLKVAEVEFKSRKQASDFLPPPWFGKEITNDDQYKNASLAERKLTT